MKTTKPKEETEVVVTTKTRLIVKGQSFDMTMEELKDLHDKIGKAIGAKPEVIYVPEKRPWDKMRPYHPPQPQWYGRSITPINPSDPLHRITRGGRTSVSMGDTF